MSQFFTAKINRINYNRKPEIENLYRKHLKKLKEKNIEIDDYILNTVLKDNFFVITKNPFPYDIDYIEHKLIWINTKYKYSDETIYKYIKFNIPDKEFYYFENDEKNKSIHRVKHYHIFVFENKPVQSNIYL